METRTTIVLLCSICFVILNRTNAYPERLELNAENYEVEAQQPVEKNSDVQQLAASNQEQVEVNDAEKVNESLSAVKEKDANEVSNLVNDQEVEIQEVVENTNAAHQQTGAQHQEDEEDDVLESGHESLSSYNVKDTSGRSKYVNNQYIPDDLPSINPKPLFDLLQREANQQHPPKPLAATYSNFGPPTVFCDKSSEVKEENHFNLPKPTKLPNIYLKPVVQPLKEQLPHKGSIKYKTVSSSSQYVATPVANLLLKLEIGIAPPSQSNEEDEEKDELGNSY